jgi:TRAP-type C4-dicarboxylate transport system substrate-binding protein
MRTIEQLGVAAAGILALNALGSVSTSVHATGADAMVLRLAGIDGSIYDSPMYIGPQRFVESLDEVSGGLLRVELTEGYGDGAPDNETRLVEAIASGALDGGWPATRSFAAAGIDGLDAVEAPMTISSYAAAKALVTGPAADMLLEQLDGSGVVGLGLAVGELRRPRAAEAPLLAPQDWAGVRFAVFDSEIQHEAVRALGAEPVAAGFARTDEIAAGNLRGAEGGATAIGGVSPVAPFVTANVVLWPKVYMLSFNADRFESLTDEQQGWVHEAADRAVQASVDADFDEPVAVQAACEAGSRFVDASPADVEAMRTAFAPVVERLAADLVDGPILAEIQAIAAEHPGPEPLDVPDSCREATATQDAAMVVPDEVSELPDGTYEVEITLADVAAAGIDNSPGWTGTWTLTIEDGTYQMSCRPVENPGKDCGSSTYEGALDAGYVRGTGNVVYFVYDAEVHSALTGCATTPEVVPPCYPLPTYAVTWALDGDLLTFSDSEPFVVYDKVLEPWTRIG